MNVRDYALEDLCIVCHGGGLFRHADDCPNAPREEPPATPRDDATDCDAGADEEGPF